MVVNIAVGIIKTVCICLFIFFCWRHGSLRAYRRYGFRYVYTDHKYLWGGFVVGLVVGFVTGLVEMFGYNVSGISNTVAASMGFNALVVMAIIAVIKAFTRYKPYGYWKRFLLNAGLFIVGMFAGLMLGGIAVWFTILLIVVFAISGAIDSSSSSRGDSSDNGPGRCCDTCRHYSWAGGTCGRTGERIDDRFRTVCNGYD